MKQGLLVVNSFFRSASFAPVQQLLQAAFAAENCALTVCGNAELLPVLGERTALPYDFALFWNKDTALAQALEQRALRVFNPAEGIRLCDDKGLTHLALEQTGLRQPRTILAPQTYENIGYPNHDYLKDVVEKLGYPIVIKERFGSFGQQVYLAKNEAELLARCEKLGGVKHLYQRFIPSVYQNRPADLRICVVGDRAIAAIRRESLSGDFRANLEEGGTAFAVTPDRAAEEMALKAVRALGLDFAGVDLLYDPDGGYDLCEVNSNFFFAGLYQATGVNPATAICRHILSAL